MIKIATFPRSGHHWLMNTVQDACKLPCNWHVDLHTGRPGPETLVGKTHDFDLTEDAVAFVMWRDPLEALCSWFEFGVRHSGWDNTKSNWRQWSLHNIKFAAAFYRKWMTIAPSDKIITYDNLVRDIDGYVKKVADAIDRPIVRPVETDSIKLRIASEFEFYDADHFNLLTDIYIDLLT